MSHTDAEERQVAQKTDEELDAEHEGRIRDTRGDLWEGLKAARDGLDLALRSENSLKRGDAYDVEYEGGGDFSDRLRQVSRLLDIVRGLMPTDAHCDLVENDQMKAVRALLLENRLSK